LLHESQEISDLYHVGITSVFSTEINKPWGRLFPSCTKPAAPET
jgi:hypothetical protein